MQHKGIIINIGRQVGSGGRVIAKRIADDFNLKFYDKELLNLAAKKSGFSEKFFEENDEQKGFFRTHFHIHVPFTSDDNYYQNNFSQEGLYKFQSDAIRQAAAEGNCVFVGRTADYILRDWDNTLNIFITANKRDRIKAVARRNNISATEADKLIRNKESDRASYYNYYTGKKWGAAESYDLCINSSLLGLEHTTEFLETFIRKRFDIKI